MSKGEDASGLMLALERSRAALMEAIAGLDEEGFRRWPAAGEWNAAEALAHLLAHEQRMLFLVRTALTEDNPSVQSRGEAQQLQEARAAQRMPVPQIVHGLLAQRRDTLLVLEPLSQEQLARTVQHLRMGEMTVGGLVQRIVHHETDHAGQIVSIRQQPTGATT